MKCLSWNFTYEGERFKCINWKETAVRMSDCTRLVLLQTNHSNTTLFSHTLRRLFQNRIYSRLLIKQFNLNLYNRTLSIYFIIKRKKEKSTIPSNKLFARCQSSMLERTGEGRGGERGWKELQRRCGRWKAVKSREQKKPEDRTAFERKGKNVYRAWATSYPALLFTGLPGAPELEVARFVSVPLPRRSIGNNYPVCNRRPPLIILLDEKDFFLILLSLSPSLSLLPRAV